MENDHELRQVAFLMEKDAELPEFLFKTLVMLKDISLSLDWHIRTTLCMPVIGFKVIHSYVFFPLCFQVINLLDSGGIYFYYSTTQFLLTS